MRALRFMAVAAAFPAAATAKAPTVELVPTVKLTTFYDQSGAPVRQTVHGALTHTIGSAWHTLVSNGPAPVHVDLATGNMVVTGKEFAFHVPGDGIVFGQDGRLTSAADGTELAFNGRSVVDVAALCAALAP